MKKLPFNACDYRCEHCLETPECAVFQALLKQSLLLGSNVNGEKDAGAVLEELRESFRETEEMIKQKARELGIEIDEIAGGASTGEILEERRNTLNDPLYKRSYEFALQANRCIIQADPLITGTDREYIQDILWHHSVISPKVFRALGWKTEGIIAEDAKNSAAVAMKSLTICIMAFDHLAGRYEPFAGEFKRLAAEGKSIKEEVRNRFKP
jgi:hypothetical protein